MDVRLSDFILRGITIGEARERGPCRRKEGSLTAVRDGSANTVFQGRVELFPIEDPTTVDPVDIMV